MSQHTRFEREDVLGNWYPLDCVIAALGAAETEPAVAALREAGFADEDIAHWSGKEVIGLVEAHGHQGGIKRLFRSMQRDLNDHDHNLNVYEQAARHGGTVIAVHAPEEEAQGRARHILRQHYAHQIKYYGRFAITDLSRN